MRVTEELLEVLLYTTRSSFEQEVQFTIRNNELWRGRGGVFFSLRQVRKV